MDFPLQAAINAEAKIVQGAKLVNLNPGSVLEGRVVASLPAAAGSQKITIDVGGAKIIVATDTPLLVGQEVKLKVAEAGSLQLALLTQPLSNPAGLKSDGVPNVIATALAKLVNQQLGFEKLLPALLAATQDAAFTKLPNDLRSRLLSLVEIFNRYQPMALTAAKGEQGALLAAIKSSGLFAEQMPQGIDLKIALLLSLSSLRRYLASGQGQGSLPTQALLAAEVKALALNARSPAWTFPTPLPPISLKMDAPESLQTQLLNILRYGSAQLARIQMHQLMSAQHQIQTQQAQGFIEIPIISADQLSFFQLWIEHEGERQSKKSGKQTQSTWRLTLAFDLDPLGCIYSRVQLLADQKIKTTFWVAEQKTLLLIQAQVQRLREKLTELGIAQAGIEILRGAPEKMKTAFEHHLVDIRT